jgi:hypothetical protein
MFSLRAEDISCSLDVLYEGLWISKLQLFIKTLDPDPHWEKMLDPGPHLDPH